MIFNPCLSSDSYKMSHFAQYPAGTQYIMSYITARGSMIPGIDEVVTAGLQMFVHEYLKIRVTRDHVNQAEIFCEKHGVPFNRPGWDRVVDVHNGYLPIHIRSVPEGTPIPLNELMMSIENTDSTMPWVTNFVETLALSYVWYCSSVATISREIKKIIFEYLKETSDDPEGEIPFKLHDFGYRGSAPGAAHIGTVGHLINFLGTDTIAGVQAAMAYYKSDVCGFSISASEHSTITTWGRENEYLAYENMVTQYAKPGAIFACVIDSYDTMNAIRLWCARDISGDGKSLLDRVKEAGAQVVLRPDSGDAVQMPVNVILEIAKYVGFTKNTKGFSVLPDHVRVIQGDGIDINDVKSILVELLDLGISASNITFGMGGGLVQKVDRDTFKFAMKACYAEVNGIPRDVQKDPSSDSSKKSKSGYLGLIREFGTYRTIDTHREETGFSSIDPRVDRMVYYHHKNDTFFSEMSMDEVRANAKI